MPNWEQRLHLPLGVGLRKGGLCTIPAQTAAGATMNATKAAPCVLPGEASLAAPWFACYTCAHAERKVDRLLKGQEVESFVPLVPLRRQWHDRLKVVEWPLFPSYIFARFPLSRLYNVLGTPGVAFVIMSNGRPAPIADREITNIAAFARALAQGGVLPVSVLFEAGERVRIVDGPFAGVEGVVVENRGRRRLLVGLKTIGLGFEVDMPSRHVRRIR